MKRVYNFLRLPAPDRRLLAESALLLGAIRVGLWLLPFQTLLHGLARMTPRTAEAQTADCGSIHRVVWAVTVASRSVPGARMCLTQALATQVLLGRRGHITHLHIGVARSDKGQLEAHAWVESRGSIVIGNLGNLSHYTPLPSLEGKRR